MGDNPKNSDFLVFVTCYLEKEIDDPHFFNCTKVGENETYAWTPLPDFSGKKRRSDRDIPEKHVATWSPFQDRPAAFDNVPAERTSDAAGRKFYNP